MEWYITAFFFEGTVILRGIILMSVTGFRNLVRLFAASIFCVALTVAAAPSFNPLPLTTGANTGFSDAQADDRQGGWLDLGGNDLRVFAPVKLSLSGVPFEVFGEAANGGKTCIVLGGPKRSYLPSEATVPVAEKKGAFLYLLHAAAWCPPAKDAKMTGVLFVDYADGAKSESHVRFGRDVGDWTKPDGFKNAARAWTAYNGNTQVSLFLSRFALKDQPVKAIRFEVKESAWMVVAATLGDETKIVGIKPDLKLEKKYSAPVLGAPLEKATANAAPKNVILFIGDGMGPGAVKLTSLYQHKADGRLVMQQLPLATFCTTLSTSNTITDSAAAATAIATGYKTDNRFLGLAPDKSRLTSFAEAARKQGRAVGIITSDSITGATPAGFYAHVNSRGSYSEVANWAAASTFDILIGNANGKGWFIPKAAGGQREDARPVMDEMSAAGYAVIENQEAFDQVPQDKRVLGFMAKGTLESDTCLAGLTETAMKRLSKNEQGFFLMVECTITDAGGHGNKPEVTVQGTLQVDWAVKSAVDFARKQGNTLVMVTADHETGGLTCGFTNDPPGKLVMDYATTSHTAEPVCFFAYGPGSEQFSGKIDNTDIGKTVARLWKLDLPPPVKADDK